MPDSAVSGRRILVVEDEYFLADELDRALRAVAATVLGPVPSVNAAFALLEGGLAPEAAVLDVNLGGEKAFPIADALADRGIPFVFVTGYDRTAVPERHADVRRLEKPVDASTTLRELERLLRAA